MMPTVDLVIDTGNSRTKVALYRDGLPVRWSGLPNGDRESLATFLGPVNPAYAVWGSVAGEVPQVMEWLLDRCPVLVVTGETPTPVRLAYGSPSTLGADRLANAVAGHRFLPGRSVLVIDIGTCITYDVVEADGTFSGGAISPGIIMRARSMNAYSARLPLVEPGDVVAPLGRSTEEALVAGINQGIVGEIGGFIETYRHQRPDMGVILTGGDALRFARALKSGIFAHPLLTLEGLHAILQHHHALSDRVPRQHGIGGDRSGPTG